MDGRCISRDLSIVLSKAYDRIEWSILKAILLKMGFCERWVKLVMECVSSVEYYVQVEGEEVGPIYPQRGLRQGDPLSPYLFILVAEGLSAMFRKYEARGLLHGIGIARGAPKISHLFFADDSFIFFRANLHESQVCKNILDAYASASGQLINFEKSSINFSKNVGEDLRESVGNIFGVRRQGNSGNYLGLPSLVGRNKREILGFIKSRIVNRIHTWSHRFLSKAGKEILLKSVIQAIPSFAMSVFLLPVVLVKEIERVMNGFWWGGENRVSKGIRWKSWEHLCVPKKWGGLGFRKLREFNMAMLSKQAWRLVQHPTSLVARVYKAKYYPNASFLEAKKGSNPSFIWTSIMETQETIRSCSRWRVGDGNSIHIWKDRWLPDQDNPLVMTTPFPYLEDAKVSSILNDQNIDWDEEVIEDIFNSRDAKLILSIPLSVRNRDDKLIWAKEEKGIFTVRSCYRALVGELPISDNMEWTVLWKLKMPPKVKIFFWQACVSCLPTADMLRQRHVDCPSLCQLCLKESETISHVLVNCEAARNCWSMFEAQSSSINHETFLGWVSQYFCQLDDDKKCLLVMICWNIWQARNDKVWHNRSTSARIIVDKARAYLRDWREATAVNVQNSSNNPSFIVKWEKPQSGWYKLNVDAAINEEGGKMGFGWVLRDDHGTFKAAKCTPWKGVYSPKEAEAIAVREALSWLKAHNYDKVTVEIDALLVLQGLHTAGNVSYFDLLLLDVKDTLSLFSHVSISFVKRSANRIAHLLAGESVSLSDCKEWLYHPPNFICNALFSDMNE